MKNGIKVILGICLMLSSSWAEGQKGPTSFTPVTQMHSLVVPITFPDAVDKSQYPSKEYLDSLLFDAKIQQFYNEMSYGKFNFTGDVLDFVVSPEPEVKNGSYQFTRDGITSEVGDLQIPNFDMTGYDQIVFLMISDYKNLGAWAGISNFTVNGVNYSGVKTLFMSPHVGNSYRDTLTGFSNPFVRIHPYAIQRGNSWVSTDREEGKIINGVTSFERTFMHELGHALGVGTHAQSRTNGSKYDYEAEVNENSGLLDKSYGNLFSIMGKSTFGLSMNMAFKTLLGWVDDGESKIIKDYGLESLTLFPMDHPQGIRGVDIRVPYDYASADWVHRNKGYTLEVRRVNFWDSMLVHPDLRGNVDGIMVNKHDGYTSRLLDMSPSANFKIGTTIVADLRDVVLKPGMTYSDGKVSFSNVVKNQDGSFSLGVSVIDPDAIVPLRLMPGLSVESYNSSKISFSTQQAGLIKVFALNGAEIYSSSFEKGSVHKSWKTSSQKGVIQIKIGSQSHILSF